MEQTHDGAGLGLIAQLQGLAQLGLRSVTTRLRLAQAEVQAEKERLFMQLIWTMVAVFLGVFGLFLGVIGLIMMTPDSWRPVILIGACGVAVLSCIAIGMRLKKTLPTEPKVLADTLDVLEQDAQALAAPLAKSVTPP